MRVENKTKHLHIEFIVTSHNRVLVIEIWIKNNLLAEIVSSHSVHVGKNVSVWSAVPN